MHSTMTEMMRIIISMEPTSIAANRKLRFGCFSHHHHDVIDDMSATSLRTPCNILPDSIHDNVSDKSHHDLTDDVISGVTDYVTYYVTVLLLLMSHWQCYC